jgi:hypothetical protein
LYEIKKRPKKRGWDACGEGMQGCRKVEEEEDGEDRIFQGVNRLAKIPSVIF